MDFSTLEPAGALLVDACGCGSSWSVEGAERTAALSELISEGILTLEGALATKEARSDDGCGVLEPALEVLAFVVALEGLRRPPFFFLTSGGLSIVTAKTRGSDMGPAAMKL